jgi:hypothetical protein
VLHELSGEDELKPRRYERLVSVEREMKCVPRMFIREGDSAHYSDGNGEDSSHKDQGDDSTVCTDRAFNEVDNALETVAKARTASDDVKQQARLVDTTSMLASNRDILRRYEPLNIGGKTLTDMSIGGFKVDLGNAARKASEVVPLPPAKLPRVYIDSEMNFNHHFFQGLEKLLGREQVITIVSRDRHYSSDEQVLLPLIEGIIKTGYEKKDTNLTVFTKSVLTSTFDMDPRSGPDGDERGLLVGANLWGFQYIEDGMECREPDLRMWLSICYDRFRNIFFNTFKDSGMPAFAMEGVQSRYEPVKSFQRLGIQEASALDLARPSIRVYDQEYYDTPLSSRTPRSHKSRRHRRPESTIGGMLFGGR